jgi:hypothetical protein
MSEMGVISWGPNSIPQSLMLMRRGNSSQYSDQAMVWTTGAPFPAVAKIFLFATRPHRPI